MTRPYFTNGVFSAFGSSGSLNNASDNPGFMSTNDISVEGIANRTDIATDNVMTDRTGTSYNHPSATNIQMPGLRDSTSWTFGSSGDVCIVEPVSAQLVVENRFASGSYQTPSFVPQQSNWSSANPFEAADSGHPRFPLDHISTSYSAHDRGAPSGVPEGTQFPSQTDGRSLATWTFAGVPTGTTRTWPPNVFYTNVTYDVARSLPIREADSNQGTYNDLSILYHTSNGASNSTVAGYSGSTGTALHCDMRHSLPYGVDLEMQIPGPTSSTLPDSALVAQEPARPVQGPKPPLANGTNNHNLKKYSKLGHGPMRKPKQTTNRKGIKRPQQEQVARDQGACRQCKSGHKKCRPNNPSDPYGPCARCMERAIRNCATINPGELQFSACQRMYTVFSGLLKRHVECGDMSERLLKCIEIDLIFSFLDTPLTGVPWGEVEVLTGLKTCITLATIHTFCLPEEALGSDKEQATWKRRYDSFFGMALYHWRKACRCLEAAYNHDRNALLWWWRIEQVAAAFTHHLHPSEELPQGNLNMNILRKYMLADAEGMHRAFWQVVGLAWYGTKKRGLFSLGEAENDGIPIQTLPSNFETAIGSKLRVLPEELSVQEVDV